MTRARTWWPAAALLGGDAAALALLRPDFAGLGAALAAPRAWLARRGPDAALADLAAAAIWLVAAWLAVGLLAAAASRLPGLAGDLAGCACRFVLPRAVRALLAGGVGVGLLLAPAAADAAGSGPAPAGLGPRPALAHVSAGATVPTPSWPVTPDAMTPVPSPRWPSAPAPQPPPPADTVTVAPGDSLWLIAARRLGPRAEPQAIAASWPRWYAANRAVIGDDPALIRPRSVLHAPPASAEEARR